MEGIYLSHISLPKQHKLRIKRRLKSDRVITIEWSGFNSNPRRTCCCVLG